MKYVDNTTEVLPWVITTLEPKDFISMMKAVCPYGADDTTRSEWVEYLLSASFYYDVVVDGMTVIFSDKE